MKNRFLNVKVLQYATEKSPQQVIMEKRDSIRSKFRGFKGSMKVIAKIELEFLQPNEKEGIAPFIRSKYFEAYISIITPPIIFRQTDNINKFISSVEKAIGEEYARLGIPSTKFQFNRTLSINLAIARFTPVWGSSYIPTYKFIADKKATVNIKNLNDNKCFLWSVLAHIHPVEKNPDRLLNYKNFEDELNMTGIKFPVELKNIDKFEKQNPYAINVLGFDEEDELISPIRVSNQKKEVPRINLMLISDIVKSDESDKSLNNQALNDEKVNHYILVKNLSRLLSSQISKAEKSN